MEKQDFEQFLTRFKSAPTDQRIKMYCTTENISKDQYKILLGSFTPSEIKKLEVELA